MKFRRSYLCGALIVLTFGLVACGKKQEDQVAEASSQINTQEVVQSNCVESMAGNSEWNVSGSTICYGETDIYDITDMDPVSDGFTDICTHNSGAAYVAYFSNQQRIVILSCTREGDVEVKASLEYSEYGGPGSVYLDFNEEKQGHLLYCSDPGAGLMKKILWSTEDGGESFELVGDISNDMNNYPADMAFLNETTGLILVKNHGYEEYAYITYDAGKHWGSYAVDEFQNANYVDGISIQKSPNDDWELSLTVVTDHGANLVSYRSEDAWKTWNVGDAE